jgi:FemAB family protein
MRTTSPNDLATLWLDCIKKTGMDAALTHSKSSEVWQSVAAQIAYLPLDYAESFFQFQCAYRAGNAGSHQVVSVTDLSLVIYHDRQAIGLWPVMALATQLAENGSTTMTLAGSSGALLSPLFYQTVQPSIREKIEKLAQASALDFCRKIAISEFLHEENLGPNNDGKNSAFHQAMLRSGASVSVDYFLYVDLLPTASEIKSSFRKSFKHLINAGQKTWTTEILSVSNFAVYAQFQALHVAVAGRATRSDLTWQMQHDGIVAGNAFLVFIRNDAGKMVAGGYFSHTQSEGVYIVGAYDRSLYEHPLGHLVQHTAIMEMKRRGMRWHKLGQCFYAGCVDAGSLKERSISVFKQGFASHQFASLKLKLCVV